MNADGGNSGESVRGRDGRGEGREIKGLSCKMDGAMDEREAQISTRCNGEQQQLRRVCKGEEMREEKEEK